jgi:rubrerythrin
VQAEIYEQDLAYIKLGQEANVTLSYLPDREFRGRVTYIYPNVDEKTRTARVRMEFHNPGYFLKPGMFATVKVVSELEPSVLLIPDMAILRSGEKATVFVVLDGGKFEPRVVTLGPQAENDEYQVLSGVSEGERIVTSGQFMLDSESQLREAIQKMQEPKKASEGETNAVASTSNATNASSSVPRSAVKYICPMPEHVSIEYDHPGKCPICGMSLVPVSQAMLKNLLPGGKILYYTCPMPEDSEVRSDKPGKCPKCGMTLIPIFAPPAAAVPANNSPGSATPAGAMIMPDGMVMPAAQRLKDNHAQGIIDFSLRNKFIVVFSARSRWFWRSVCRAQHSARRHSRPVGRAGHHLHRMARPGAADRPGSGHLSHHHQNAFRAGGARSCAVILSTAFSFVYVIFKDGTDPYWARSRVLEYLNGLGGQLPQGVTPEARPGRHRRRLGLHVFAQFHQPRSGATAFDAGLVSALPTASVEGVSRSPPSAVSSSSTRSRWTPPNCAPTTFPFPTWHGGQEKQRRGGRPFHRTVRKGIHSARQRLRPKPRRFAQGGRGCGWGSPDSPGGGGQRGIRPGHAARHRRAERGGGNGGRHCGRALRRQRPAGHQDVKKRLDQAMKGLPSDVKYTVAYDRSALIDRAVKTLEESSSRRASSWRWSASHF